MKIREIKSVIDEAVSVYCQLNENQLKHIHEPEEGLFIAESEHVIERAMDAGYFPESFFVEKARLNKAERLFPGFPDADIYVAETDIISEITGFPLTGGILSAMRRRKLPDCDELLRNSNHVAILADIENPTNVGAIFRSAAALGMDAVIMSHGSCDPLYRRAIRVSMGTVFQIPWTVTDEKDRKINIFELLKKNKYQTVATALSPDSKPIEQMRGQWGRKTAVFFGSEGNGLPEDIIRSCDHRVIIPMSGGVDSLNVAASSAVIFWEMAKT
ncbi:MAG: RNA methyltransferase [Lachnospiraceae bacterium]|nr:RNA methyltransferase [Lachnospiraceae bacterium]